MRLSLDKLISYWSKATPSNKALSVNGRDISYKTLFSDVNKVNIKVLSSELYGLIIDDNYSFIIIMLSLMRAKKKFINIGRIVGISDLNNFLSKNNIVNIISDDNDIIKKFNGIDAKSILNNNYESESIQVNQNLYDIVGGFLSSGSTGVPKVYYRTQYSLISEALLWLIELQLNNKTVFYISKPFTYIGSFVLLYSVLYSGGNLVIPSKYCSELYIPETNIDFALLLPNDIKKLIVKNEHLNAKNIITMGAPITLNEKKTFSKIYSCNVLEMWGNSEGLATLLKLEDQNEDGIIGRATFTDEIFIVDKNGNKLCNGEIGYIAGITDNCVTLNEDNDIIISEDIGFIDSKLQVHLIGRSNNTIVFDKKNYFSTSRLENMLKKKYNIENCVVLLLGNTYYIFILDTNHDLIIEMQNYCHDLYSDYLDIIKFGRIITVNEIPQTVNGKIDYVLLQTMI